MNNTVKKINLSLQFENFLSDMYGKINYHGSVGWTEFSTYKKHILKLSNSLKSAIEINIQDIDALHYKSLLDRIEILEKEVRESGSVEELGQSVVLRMFQLVFLLVGDTPNNWDLKKKTHKTHFSLKKHRGIHYSQSLEQKFNSIIDNAPSNQFSEMKYSKQMLLNSFTTEHNRDFKRFLDWHKKSFPETHLTVI
jgi:hypothetical protein